VGRPSGQSGPRPWSQQRPRTTAVAAHGSTCGRPPDAPATTPIPLTPPSLPWTRHASGQSSSRCINKAGTRRTVGTCRRSHLGLTRGRGRHRHCRRGLPIRARRHDLNQLDRRGAHNRGALTGKTRNLPSLLQGVPSGAHCAGRERSMIRPVLADPAGSGQFAGHLGDAPSGLGESTEAVARGARGPGARCRRIVMALAPLARRSGDARLATGRPPPGTRGRRLNRTHRATSSPGRRRCPRWVARPA
jgi:hypothetical protein